MLTVAKQKPTPFAARLRELRKAVGYAQTAAAEAVGVSAMTYIRWERGETEPTYSQLVKLAELFGVEFHELHPDAE